MNKKTCCKCSESKPLDQFYKAPTDKSGRQSYCAICCNEYTRQWQQRHPERTAFLNRRWRKNNPDKVRAIQRKGDSLYRKRYRDRLIGRSRVSNAIASGRLTRQPCVVCGTTENIWAYIKDYSKPLDVVWACHPHHWDLRTGRLTLAEVAV